MKIQTVAAAFLAAAALLPASAAGQQLLDSYCTLITENDKSASDGYRLSDAASIIRQDRANFHRFGYRDQGDEGDRTFGSVAARERIPAMLDNGDSDPQVLRNIVRGTPYICVEVYPGYLYVYEN